MQLRNGLTGFLAGALGVLASELVSSWHPSGRSPIAVVGDAVIRLTPGPVVRAAIDTFGDDNRAVLWAVMAITMTVFAVVLGFAEARRRWSGVAGMVALAALGALAGVADPLTPWSVGVGAPVVGALVGGFAMRLLADAAVLPPNASTVTAERSRRAFLRAAMAAGAVTAVGLFLRAGQRPSPEPERSSDLAHLPEPRHRVARPAAAASLAVPGLSPLLTPNREFYRVDTALVIPQIDADGHTVRVTGMVDQPLELSYADLLELADTEAYVTLACVSNLVGGSLVGNARWQGVPLARLLDAAGIRPEATQIVGRAVDGWTAGFPVEAAFDGRPAMVAVGMNGEPLPLEHGFPVRLVIAGLYGYVSDTKWLAEIELTTFEDHDAYWVPRGWARHAPVKTQSRIDVPRMGGVVDRGEVVVAGVAWSDERGVSAVEVAADSGAWRPAEIAAELAATSWRQWRLVWDATPGDHLLQVRAYDADGIPQTSETAGPAPDGATGWHRVRVTVR